MASTRRTRKDISQSQRDMLISLWETKGMRTAKSEHLNEATINTGLSKNQIKRWIYNYNASIRPRVQKVKPFRKRRFTGYNLFCSSIKKQNIGIFNTVA
ncbi:uncharacterized protein LOC143468593 isoform X2 [Clavelina lepadiformis]|uniref:uncharacterized protein LOC143468593 isoform X2 n=1 Tax=Clavelina lepadiformis TaxID=159417 RepID=UPI004042171C